MDPRRVKGMEIAQRGRIRKTSRGWIVQSQSDRGSYLVYRKGEKTVCSCPDYTTRTLKCKHLWAVELLYEKKTDQQGNTTITKAIRIIYLQNWKLYTQAQNREVELFHSLLADLVRSVKEPIQVFGRPRLGLQDIIYCAIEKVYSQLSSRRAHTLYREAMGREAIQKVPNYNSINILLNKNELTPILQRLLALSALPLKSMETTFATDSSGFRCSQFGQYAIERYGLMRRHKWIKAHVLVGTKTNVIASARVLEGNSPDSPQFTPLLTEAHESGFNIQEIVADMGYSSRENYEQAKKIGATAYIPFKSNATGRAGGSGLWKRMYHYFMLNREEFLSHYHARSNVEACFHAIKMKFGDRLKAKNFVAQRNELLCKFIAYNIVVLIHEMHELGILNVKYLKP